MSWQEIRVGDLGEIITGKTPPTSNVDNYGGNIPFITPSDMVGNRSIVSTERYISEKGKNTIKNSILPPHAVCVSCIGSDMGKVVLTTAWSATNQQINSIVCNSHYDYRFVYYLMLTLRETIKSLGKNATAVPILNKTKFSNIQVAVPSLPIQKRIADFLSYYDDLIENNQKQIKLLEEAAQRLYKEWFVDLRFPGHETTPIVDGVPEGWCVSSVGDCSCFLRRGISPKYNEEGSSIVINQKCIRQSVVDLNEARRQEKSFDPEMNLNDSDTVICSTGAGTLGRVGQVFGQQPNTTFDSHVTLVRASNIVGRQYLYHFLKSKQQYLQGMGKGSTNQLELNRATIQELVLLIPSVKTQNAFECQAQPIHDQITTLTKQIALLQEARDKLLPKLMRGELENEDF